MSESITSNLNRCFLLFDDRAERFTAEQIVNTFVTAGPILDVLANRSHQVIYGRRGVGKTHALRYFANTANGRGDIAIYVDCSNIGSNNSQYSDTSLSLSERATHLLIDICVTMQQKFLEVFADPRKGWSLADAAPMLNDFVDAATQKSVDGSVSYERSVEESDDSKSGFEAKADLAPKFGISANLSSAEQFKETILRKEKREGTEHFRVNFQFLNKNTGKVAQYVAPKRIWLLMDEWSTVQRDLQPYLADLIRRSFFSIPNVSVKIAAVEQRSTFRQERKAGGYIGIELGADASVALNLDDYLVFDVNPSRSKKVFEDLIRNHIISISNDVGVHLDEQIYDDWTKHAFTNENVFVELVQASEGVPRDAMHILQAAAQVAGDKPISAPVLRAAALKFFQMEKYAAVSANPLNQKMLDWIRFEVINKRSTRAFLIPVGVEDSVISNLFDLRVLHVLNRSMSAAHKPSERFVVYKIDYGCYVDLTNTGKFPRGSLTPGEEKIEINFNVPDDDKRSYRRAILDISEFYKERPQQLMLF